MSSSVLHRRIKLHPSYLHWDCSVSDAPVTSNDYASSKLFLTVDGKKFLVVLCVMEQAQGFQSRGEMDAGGDNGSQGLPAQFA